MTWHDPLLITATTQLNYRIESIYTQTHPFLPPIFLPLYYYYFLSPNRTELPAPTETKGAKAKQD